jgi:hypothetical protein
MAFKARVYLCSGPEKSQARYIGEIDVTPRPVRNGRTVFIHAGKTETGHVEAVDPPDWDEIGAIPTIHVTLSPGKSQRPRE